jgi:clan AA aspartic protease (TIGR02281 family)
MRPAAACLIAVVLVSLAPGCHPSPPARTLLPPGGADVPIRLWHGLPVVDVTVDGKGPYPFVLDTGTTRVCITPALAEELGLPKGGARARARTANGKVIRLVTTRLDSLSIGDATFEGVDALVVPRAYGGVGLLGMRLFAHTVLTVRFSRQRLAIGPQHLSASDPYTLPVRFYKGVPTVPVSPPVRGPRWTPYVVLDTGMNGGIHLPVAERRRLSVDPSVRGRQHGLTAGGRQTLDVVRLRGPLRVGRYAVDDAAVALEPGRGRGRLGSLFLRRFDLTVDTAARRVRLFLAGPRPASRPAATGPTAVDP